MPSPGPLDQPIDRFVPAAPSVAGYVESLRAHGLRVCFFENLPSAPVASAALDSMTPRRILESLVAQCPGFRWEEASGLINVVPLESVLDSPLPDAAVQRKAVWNVLDEDLQIGRFGISRFDQFSDSQGRPVSVAWKDADLRAALNTIALQMPASVWHISGRPGAYFLSFTLVPLG